MKILNVEVTGKSTKKSIFYKKYQSDTRYRSMVDRYIMNLNNPYTILVNGKTKSVDVDKLLNIYGEFNGRKRKGKMVKK